MKKLVLLFIIVSLLVLPSCKKAAEQSLNLPIISFTANPTTIYYGDSTILTWNVSNATSVIISPLLGNVASSGSQEIVNFSTDTVFTLTASNNDGIEARNLTVTVLPGPIMYYVKSFVEGWKWGFPTVYGMVGNRGNGPAYNVVVRCLAFDSNSILLDTTLWHYTNPTTIVAGATATYEATFLFLSGWKKVASVLLEISYTYGSSSITQTFLHDLKTGKLIKQETVIN